MKNCLYAAFFAVLSLCAAAQQKTAPPVSFPTPNAASLGQYGQIPVSYFNGLPNISIPLHVVKERSVTLPITLSYQALGVRPDQHPGWVGLGWNLTTGGTITRIVNGAPDEVIIDGTSQAYKDSESYFVNYNALSDNSNWYKEAVLKPILEKITGASTAIPNVMPMPDEFIFNFGQYSGSFFMDHTGEWRVRSANAKGIRISLTQDSYSLSSGSSSPLTLLRIIKQITITGVDGNKYIFGGTDESIEFSRNEGPKTYGNNNIVPTSWMLTKVILTTGEEIILNYERGGYAVLNSDSWSTYYYSNGSTLITSGTGAPRILHTLINPVYLKEIVTKSQTITFTRTLTSELTFPENTATPWQGSGSTMYEDIGTQGSQWYKLTNITVKDNFTGSNVKKFDFTYKDESTSRLMLMAVQEKDPANVAVKNPYEFHYYDSPYFDLPPYISRQVDHWGFYNHRDFFSTVYGTVPFTAAYNSIYKSFRDSDPEYLLEGTLSNVFYPTGGQTEFQYEANEYSYVAQTYESSPYFSLLSLGSSGQKKIAGGLRIKKIISRTGDATPNVSEFFYNESANTYPATSSGVLGGDPTYFEILRPLFSLYCYSAAGVPGGSCVDVSTAQYQMFTNHPIYALSYTNGNHVTYSEVREKFSDGSYKVYKYTNHNNSAYRNTDVLGAGYTYVASQANMKYTDMSLVRGKILTEESFNTSNKLMQKISYEYSFNFDDYVRFAEPTATSAAGTIGVQLFAYKKYLFEPLVSKMTVDTYNQDNTNYTSSVKDFEYDLTTNVLKKQTIQTSDGTSLISTYKYPKDKLTLSSAFTSPDLTVVDGMLSKNIIAPVLEVDELRGTTLLKRTNTFFKKWTFGSVDLYLPGSQKYKYGSGATITDTEFHSYDSKGNLLTYSASNSPKTSYKWGYGEELPIANIFNAAANEFFYENFEDNGALTPGTAHTGVRSKSGNYSIAFVRPNSRAYTLTYWKLTGGSWMFNSQPYTTDNYTIVSSDPLDDIAVFPSDGTISSYTYRPLIGMSSEIDQSGYTQFYNYDGLSRLSSIQDQQKNIVKSFSYQFANTAPNWVNTGVTTCEQINDADYNNAVAVTGYRAVEQRDLNPYSFTYNTLRNVRGSLDASNCAATYYYKADIDSYTMSSVAIYAKRSYDDGTSKTMRFRIRYDSLLYGGAEVTDYVDIPISSLTSNVGSTVYSCSAGTYIEVELYSIF